MYTLLLFCDLKYIKKNISNNKYTFIRFDEYMNFYFTEHYFVTRQSMTFLFNREKTIVSINIKQTNIKENIHDK